MDLGNKYVWDLSREEIEYVYRHRHMNNYVYAALQNYYTSSPPLNRPVSLRSGSIPSYLHASVTKLLKVSPLIGKYNPSIVRTAVTYYTYLLYTDLARVAREEIPVLAPFLGACAYLSIHSEKNDNLRLWNKPVVRSMSEESRVIMGQLLAPPIDIEQICMLARLDIGEGKGRGKRERGGVGCRDPGNLFTFMPLVMISIITHMENGEEPQRIEQALLNTEQAMCEYETGCTEPLPPLYAERNRLRYHNTLYLYGGMFFQRRGQHKAAVDWYLKHIEVPGLPELFGNFLTDLKTTERLICAYPLVDDTERQRSLKDLIHRCLVRVCQNAAKHAKRVEDYYRMFPLSDMRSQAFEATGTRILYSGEASRELYLCALVYNKCVLGVDYGDINYATFFQY